jgi:hypothetical protein
LDCACCEGFAFPDVLDVVHDRNLGVASENEVAVHAVDGKVRGYGSLGGGEALRDDGTAVDTAGSWGMPERSGVGEDILGRVRRGWEKPGKRAYWAND